MVDVTDATFQRDVIERSKSVPVVVDLWAEWCGPCKTLGPIIEKVVAEMGGSVELAKVDVDSNPKVAQAFGVQSIPAVFALSDGKVVDTFIGALPEHEVRTFIEKLVPGASRIDLLIEAGDEDSLRVALMEDPQSDLAAATLAELLIEKGELDEAKGLLVKFPETQHISRALAHLRLAESKDAVSSLEDVEKELESLLANVKADEVARQRFVDLLTLFPEGDARVLTYRRQLTSRLF